MTNINLLPWREELREERKQEFLVSLAFMVGFAFGILFLTDRYINSGIQNQTARNDYISQQIVLLDAELAEITELRAQKALLTERMAVIQDLQGTRPVIVRLFDELVKTLPEDVYYNAVSREQESIHLEGVAKAYGLVSDLMRQLDSSDWFSNPVLEQTTAVSASNSGFSGDSASIAFILNMNVVRPEPEQEQE